VNTSSNHPALPRVYDFDQFNAQINDTFCPMDAESNDLAAPFWGSLASHSLGEVGFAAVKSSPLDVYRRRTNIAEHSDSSYLVKVQVEGKSTVLHRGREAHLTPGDFTLCLSSEPYELHFPAEYSQVVLAVPEKLMEECVRHPSQYLGLRMDSQVGANGLFSQFVTSIASRMDSLDGVLAQRLEANVIDLLSTTLGHAQEEQKHDLLSAGVKTEYLNRIHHFVRRHLDDERLKPDWIAAAHNISTRYLHMRFEGEGESISRYIHRLRLEACAAALANGGFWGYSVSEIGYRFGFNDASHFSRTFKSHFGETPARYRKLNAQS
jgi:AraC-like DNA-binding protein